MEKNDFVEVEEKVKPVAETKVEEMTFEEKAKRAGEMINEDAKNLDAEDVVAMYVQGVKLYGWEFEQYVVHSIRMLVVNTMKHFSYGLRKTKFDKEVFMDILTNSPLASKTKEELIEMCKAEMIGRAVFKANQKWQMVLLLHDWVEDSDEAGIIVEDTI